MPEAISQPTRGDLEEHVSENEGAENRAQMHMVEFEFMLNRWTRNGNVHAIEIRNHAKDEEKAQNPLLDALDATAHFGLCVVGFLSSGANEALEPHDWKRAFNKLDA
jgi:hypothetical protein